MKISIHGEWSDAILVGRTSEEVKKETAFELLGHARNQGQPKPLLKGDDTSEAEAGTSRAAYCGKVSFTS